MTVQIWRTPSTISLLSPDLTPYFCEVLRRRGAFQKLFRVLCWLINDNEPAVECGVSSKGNACRLLPSVRPSVRPSVQRRPVRPSQKAPGEQGEQLVSLVWLKEKQRGNHFMTPARPIKDAEGLRGGRRGEAAAAGARLHCPRSRRLSLPRRFTPHNSRCCYDGERG